MVFKHIAGARDFDLGGGFQHYYPTWCFNIVLDLHLCHKGGVRVAGGGGKGGGGKARGKGKRGAATGSGRGCCAGRLS
jgi:hypothetical protein